MKERTLIIFDVDGTLLDSVAFQYHNVNDTLKQLGYKRVVSMETIRAHLGCSGQSFYESILPQALHQHIDQIIVLNRKKYKEMMTRYGRAFEGVEETFKALHEAGKTLVLYSNCSRSYLESAIEVTGIAPYIAYAECVGDQGIHKNELLGQLIQKYAPQQAVVVGDRLHDVEAAEANDIPCIVANYGYGEACLKQQAYQVRTITELLTYLV